MILTYFFHQTLNRCFSYIRSKENKIRKIWSLKVYSNFNTEGDPANLEAESPMNCGIRITPSGVAFDRLNRRDRLRVFPYGSCKF